MRRAWLGRTQRYRELRTLVHALTYRFTPFGSEMPPYLRDGSPGLCYNPRRVIFGVNFGGRTKIIF